MKIREWDRPRQPPKPRTWATRAYNWTTRMTYCSTAAQRRVNSLIKIYNTNLLSGLQILSLCNMMTSSNGNIFRVTGPLCGEFTGPGEFPAQRPVTRSFDVFFDQRLNNRLSKQPWGCWFETLSCSLWRHRNEVEFVYAICWLWIFLSLRVISTTAIERLNCIVHGTINYTSTNKLSLIWMYGAL